MTKMKRSEKWMMRLFALVWLLAWSAGVFALFVFWEHLPLYVSFPLGIFALVFAPDFTTLRKMLKGEDVSPPG